MRNRRNQYYSNQPQYHNQHEGYHHHHNQYGGYPQQPYYQPNPQPYHDPHRQGYQNEGYYESRNPNLFYLLIVLGFVAYGVYYLNKNYGTSDTTGESTFELTSTPDQGLNNTTTAPDPDQNNNTATPNYYDSSGGTAPPEEITDVDEGFSGRDQTSTDDMYNEVYVVETPDQPSTPVRTFYVQESVYENWANAKKQQDKLILEGRKAIVIQFDDGSLLYRLIVGEFTSEAEAIARAQKLKSGRIFELVNGKFYEM